MQEKLYDLLMELPKENLINLMWGALDFMQAYNGRTRTYCIMLALGAESNEDNSSWVMPSVESAKEATENMCL